MCSERLRETDVVFKIKVLSLLHVFKKRNLAF